MVTFICLLIVHFVADFFLQRDAWIQSKIKYKIKSFGLFKHIMVHLTLNAAVLLLILGHVDTQFWIALLTIVLTHYAIDIWKCYQEFSIKAFLIDQISHVLILAAVSLYLSQLLTVESLKIFASQLEAKELAVLAALIFLSKPMSFIIYLALAGYNKTTDVESGLKSAGEWIGFLERLLVFTFVLLDQFTGVGFLLAAKSVFRFGDMRRQQDRQLTEYIMLGTFMSVTSALLVGLLVASL